MKRAVQLLVAAVIAVLGFAVPTLAHGPVARNAEGDAASARLFTSDSATGEVIAIDLPSGTVVTRLATPPYILTLGLTTASWSGGAALPPRRHACRASIAERA